jgi:hypothetical protein
MYRHLEGSLTIGALLAVVLAGAAQGADATPSTVYLYDGAGNVTGILNTATDPDNCGGVGSSYDCSSTHITPACAASVCSGTCAAGYADCNRDKLHDGCEVSLMTSSANCGACGVACASGFGCVTGVCRKNCPTGQADFCGDGICRLTTTRCP